MDKDFVVLCEKDGKSFQRLFGFEYLVLCALCISYVVIEAVISNVEKRLELSISLKCICVKGWAMFLLSKTSEYGESHELTSKIIAEARDILRNLRWGAIKFKSTREA